MRRIRLTLVEGLPPMTKPVAKPDEGRASCLARPALMFERPLCSALMFGPLQEVSMPLLYVVVIRK
jgi:hypothetical protein